MTFFFVVVVAVVVVDTNVPISLLRVVCVFAAIKESVPGTKNLEHANFYNFFFVLQKHKLSSSPLIIELHP